MAIRFQPLALKDDALFGVRLCGAFGRADKQTVLDFAAKCVANGRVHVVLDLAEMGVIGGGGARSLAELQQQLVAAGGEVVMAGASDTVRQFLGPKFEGLPLHFFVSVDDADLHFKAASYDFETALAASRSQPDGSAGAPGPGTTPAADDPGDPDDPDDPDEEIGAIGLMEDVDDVDDHADADHDAARDADLVPAPADAPEAPAAPLAAEDTPADDSMNDVLEEFNGPAENEEAKRGRGRRKHHQYTSLPEAVAALGNWSEHGGHAEFAKALGNLLFSHGLADESLLLTVQDDALVDAHGDWALATDGDLAQQVGDHAAPLTLIDIQMNELSDRELELLENFTPEIILPIMRDDQLSAILLLKRTGEDTEYSVAEHFALELLMRVLAENQRSTAAEETAPRRTVDMSGGLNATPDAPLAPAEVALEPGSEDSVAETLLELALNLPEADDRPHFWRLFARHTWRVLPIKGLAFLPPRMHRAQIITGDASEWRGINLGEKKLQHFFRSMERPVEVAYLPAFFREIKAALTLTGAQWIVGLKFDQEFLGTVFISLEKEFQHDDPRELLETVFKETARLLSRFDDSHDNADVNLNLVRLLIAQREQRCHGTDSLTQAMCDELHILAGVMGFPPEQERNLIYGCLLRDIGLMAHDDELSATPEQLDPTQWPVYRQHPTEGAKLLAGLNLPQTILDVVRCHHERFNGEGFPARLSGRKIPLAARLVTVVENYVGMVNGVGGRQEMSHEAAARILRDNLGDRYDPDIVSLFLKSKEAELEDPADVAVSRRSRVPARV